MTSPSLTRLQSFYGELDALPLLRALIQNEFREHVALLTSFGADSALLLSLVAEINPATPVFFLETGKHFPETLTYAQQLEQTLKLSNTHWLTPDPALLERTDPVGALWKTQPNRCCWLRKVEPLDRAIEQHGIRALITGRKRYQTPERAEMQTIELDAQGIFRINPLALWTKARQKEEIQTRGLPPHPLVAQGYRSIGCAPCTSPVEEGQDDRAGRWAHTIGLDEEQKTECGIHIPDEAMGWSV